MFDRFKGKGTCFLVFHRVVKPTQKHKNYSPPPTALDVTVFEEIINIIAKKCYPLSIDEALYKIKRHRLPPKTFVITFDDGYLDNYEIALPILHRYQVPAIIYITSGFIDSSVCPFEYQLASIVSSKKEITFLWSGNAYMWYLNDDKIRSECYHFIKKTLKYEPNAIRQRALKQLDPEEVYIHSVDFLSKNHLNELSVSPLITLGSHTHYHQVLTAVSQEEAQQDIAKGKQLLERWVGYSIDHFSYPYGSYNPTIRSLVRNAGFESAVITKPGSMKGKDQFAIPRFDITSLNDFYRILNDIAR